MAASVQDRIRLSMKSPYLWMVRGVIGLAGLLYTPWMLALLPLSELLVQTWFDAIFKERLDIRNSTELAAREAEQLVALSKTDRAWYQSVKDAVRQIRSGLEPAYRNQIDFEALVRSFYERLVSLRQIQDADKETQESSLQYEMKKQQAALDAETDPKVREAMADRLSLLKQRLDLKQKLGARARQMEVQLKLVEEQVLLLRDSAMSSLVQNGHGALAGKDADHGVGESIEVLSRQLQICTELDDEMQTMMRDPSRARTREG